MNKFILNISSLFNKFSRIPVLDYSGNPKPGMFENGPLSCQKVDICIEGHPQVEDLINTKTFGSLFQTGQMVFKDVTSLHEAVSSQYSRPSDPLLTSSVRISFDSDGARKESKLTNTKDTVFSLATPDKPIRHAQAKSDKRDISFISLVVRQPREKATVVFD